LDPGSAGDWTARAILDSDFGTLHRVVLIDMARVNRINPTTISIYISFESMFTDLPGGCIGIVGRDPDPVLVELAAEQARTISLPTSVNYREQPGCTVLEVQLGHLAMANGVLNVSRNFQRRLGGDRFPVFFDRVQYGNLGLSVANLYGLMGCLKAAEVAPGDVIHLAVDFDNHVAEFKLASGSELDDED
jgi:hypothetical protein